jgi:hypothetical protein
VTGWSPTSGRSVRSVIAAPSGRWESRYHNINSNEAQRLVVVTVAGTVLTWAIVREAVIRLC